MNIYKRMIVPILACFFVWSHVHALTQDKKNREAPPVITGIHDIIIDQNSKAVHALDLWQYTSDPDTPVSAILFSISRAEESYFQNVNLAKLEDNRYLNISPDEGWAGEEELLVEANDGTNIGYAAFKVVVRSNEAGRKIEAEDGTQVERKGAWVTMPATTFGTNWIQSSRPGDSLHLKWKGSSLSVTLWGRELNLLQIYYQSPDYSVTYSSWKTYRPGRRFDSNRWETTGGDRPFPDRKNGLGRISCRLGPRARRSRA